MSQSLPSIFGLSEAIGLCDGAHHAADIGDAERLDKHKQTCSEPEMEQKVQWEPLLTQIEPHYPHSGRVGRPPYAMQTELRIHLLLQWHSLSDPGIEKALHENASMRQFVPLKRPHPISDEATIL